jgi:hypothetical protein
MATKRKYAYYINGNKLAIIQREDVLAGSSNDEYGMYKSPTESITDGLEIQYAYTPTYRINDIEDKSTAITGYDESSGLLKFTGSGLSTDSAIKYIVISASEKWNGLHKIDTLNANYWIVETKYNGAAVTESVTAYTDVSVLQDETFELDISRYQANALVYYLKAKLAEDGGDIEMREFFMREFKRQLEKSTSALKRGPYIIQGFKEMR